VPKAILLSGTVKVPDMVVVPDAVKVPDIVAVPATVKVLPEPTFKPTDVPFPALANKASTASKSSLIRPPQALEDPPTLGLDKS
jgi:hypothetical protein